MTATPQTNLESKHSNINPSKKCNLFPIREKRNFIPHKNAFSKPQQLFRLSRHAIFLVTTSKILRSRFHPKRVGGGFVAFVRVL